MPENDDDGADLVDVNIDGGVFPINCPIEMDELVKAVKGLKNDKVSTDDAIINEYINKSMDKMCEVYLKLFNIIFDSGKIPETWLTGNIVPIYKNKGSKSDPKNYRPIKIVSCFGKLFTAILNERLQKYSSELRIISENQAGFRRGYSTMDNIFVLKCLLNLVKSKRKKLYCIFIDFEKAFDKTWRNGLWNKMILNKIDGKKVSNNI